MSNKPTPKATYRLYQYIVNRSPNIPKDAIYTKEDLISQVYLEAVSKGLTPGPEVDKLIAAKSISRYRPKYPSHSTATFTAEELEIYCRDRLAPENVIESSPSAQVLFDNLTQAFINLESTSVYFRDFLALARRSLQ